MPTRTLSEQWESLRPRFERLWSLMGTPERSHSLVLLLWPIAAIVIAVLALRKISTAKDLADLISAIASLMWPVVIVVIVSWFRPEIRAFVSRLRKGKFLGNEFELDQLQAKAEAAEAKVELRAESELRVDAEVKRSTGPEISSDLAHDTIEEVLKEASQSPRLGLILLSTKIEKAAHQLAADAGIDRSSRLRPLSHLIQALVQEEQLPSEAGEALNLFYQVRNRVVHAREVDDDEIARAIDSGTRLLRLLLASPRQPPD